MKPKTPGPDVAVWFEQLIGYVLLAGVALTGVALLVGSIWRWVLGTSPQTPFLETTFAGLWRQSLGAFAAGPVRPVNWIELGLACLLGTPYLRVILSVFYFLVAERNWKYVAITFFVLAFLTIHLFLPSHGR